MKSRILFLILFLFFGLNLFAKDIVEINIKGIITSVSTSIVEKGLEEAKNLDNVLLIRIDTPGGLLSSTREIVKLLLNTDVNVFTVVSPSGARAGSAGSFIVLASKYAVMYDGCNIGAAHPVSFTGKDIKGDMRKKVENDTIAFMKSIAKKRGRNAKYAVLMVSESASFTSDEALKYGLIDKVVSDETELRNYISGKIGAKSLNFVKIKPTAFESIKILLSDPNILVFLLLITLLGLYLEIKFGGVYIFAAMSAVSFLLFLIGLNIIPINYFALLLFLGGIGLLILELFVPSFGLLTLSAVVLIVFGLLLMFKTEQNMGIKISWFSISFILVLILSVVFVIGRLILKDFKKKPVTGSEKLLGMKCQVVEWNGKEGKVFINGEYWDAVSDYELKKGDTVVVKKVDGLKLVVVPDE